MKKLTIAVIILGLAGFLGNASAQITFGTPSTFNDNSVIISGPLNYAIALGSASDIPDVGPQGITFQADAVNGNNDNITFTPFTPASPPPSSVASFTGYLNGDSTGDTQFDIVLNSAFYNGTALEGTAVTLNNLVAGRSYTLQVFVVDARSVSNGNTFTVTGTTTTTPLTYANEGTPLGGQVTGTFTATGTTETFDENAYLGGNPSDDDFQINAIVLDISNYNLASTPGLTPNQKSVAQNLDLAPLTGPLGAIIALIGNNTNPASIGSDLDELSPEKLQIFRNIAFDNFGFTVLGIDNHLASLRYGQGGFDTSGLAILDPTDSPMMSQIKGHLLAFNPTPDNGTISDSPGALLGGVQMTDPKDMKQTCCPATEANRWSAFVTGSVILGDLSHNIDDSHADYTTGGVTAGADYRIDDHFAVGGFFAYGHTDATLDADGSHARVDSYSPGLYATYADHGWFANAIVAYDYNSYGENRAITFAGTSADGATDGNQYNGDLDGGYEFHDGNWTFGPTAAVQYVHLDINNFTETGAGPADLDINDENADSLRSRLGGEVRYNWAWYGGKVTATPHLLASWQHECLDNSNGITSQFDGSGLGSFQVNASTQDRDSALIDAGIDTQWNNALSLFIDYQAQAGQSNFFAQSVQAGVKISF